jgi:hypothetical protein
VNNWQPIETAPKDGRLLRVAYDNDLKNFEDGVYWQREGRCCVLGSRAGSFPPGWTSTEAGNLPVDPPTHWQPLPTPTE